MVCGTRSCARNSALGTILCQGLKNDDAVRGAPVVRRSILSRVMVRDPTAFGYEARWVLLVVDLAYDHDEPLHV